MKICPKCNEHHTKAGIFCCRSCANSRIWGKEQKEKKSETLKHTLLLLGKEYLIDRCVKGIPARSAIARKQLLDTEFSKLGYSGRRKRVLIEQDYKCNKCNLTEWLNAPISLELEHKDGNKKNNSRENLECLCPNCHAQTPTWRGRNRLIPL